MKVGETETKTLVVEVCKACDCVVEIGLCSYGCPYDANHHGPGTILVKTYQCVETLLSVEEK